MAILCGLLGPISCGRFYTKIGGMFKKNKAKAEAVELVIGEPYDARHEVHISQDDVNCAMAATGGNVLSMDDMTKWRSEAGFFNVKTQDEELAGKDGDEVSGKDVTKISGKEVDEISGEDVDVIPGKDVDEISGKGVDMISGKDVDVI